MDIYFSTISIVYFFSTFFQSNKLTHKKWTFYANALFLYLFSQCFSFPVVPRPNLALNHRGGAELCIIMFIKHLVILIVF